MSENKWTPVDKGLPDDFKRVVVWLVVGYEQATYGIAYQVEDVWYGDAYGRDQCVLAWAPLPEPYEEV